jgi:bifunctional non-homologous end joining protein LigD
VPLSSVPLSHPTLVARPFHHEGWIYEEKVDGYRLVAYKDDNHVRLISRQGKDLTHRFAEVAFAIKGLRLRTLVLDGEVAVYDQQLISRFECLRARPKDEVVTPPMFIAFDLLRLDEGDLRPQPLRVRRERLEYALDGAPAVLLPVRRLADDGLKAWREVLERGYEGLVAKDPQSPYVGGRALKWLKVKQRNYRVEDRGWETKL